jgi:hypothetical protein
MKMDGWILTRISVLQFALERKIFLFWNSTSWGGRERESEHVVRERDRERNDKNNFSVLLTADQTNYLHKTFLPKDVERLNKD